jgi:two-component system, OmpR family, sensor histidine kinase SenX3
MNDLRTTGELLGSVRAQQLPGPDLRPRNRTIGRVEVVAVAAALLAGLAAGIGIGLVVRARRTTLAPAPPVVTHEVIAPAALARRVLEVMQDAAVVLDGSDDVVLANPAARRMGVVRGGRVVVDELRRLARAARHDGEPRHAVVDTPRGRLGRHPIAVSAQIAPLIGSDCVAMVLEDVTEARRLEAVRRDFVANVSHELKTPIGALTLLAEAVQDAADDPEAIRRFAERMQREGTRLGRLVAELIELSRLQGAEPLPSPTVVSVDAVVAEAVDRTRLAAESAGIVVVAGGQRGLTVRGNESQLVTALVNLVDNAVAYSPAGTRVAVGTRGLPGRVDISVSDQGIGIPEGDLERVFERFFRSDPARSRATGGTGLGLAIVKHIATNHGGEVGVWSIEGSGSTFTLRLPAASERPDAGNDLGAGSAGFAGFGGLAGSTGSTGSTAGSAGSAGSRAEAGAAGWAADDRTRAGVRAERGRGTA